MDTPGKLKKKKRTNVKLSKEKQGNKTKIKEDQEGGKKGVYS